MICEKCGKEFNEDWRKDRKTRKKPCRFCSRICSNSRAQTEETKKKIGEKLSFLEKKYCFTCNKLLSHNNKSGFCRKCKVPIVSPTESTRRTRRKKKLELVKIKGGKCEICGYNKCISALAFHHKDPKEKEFNLSRTDNKNIKDCIEEVKKCILVCMNCHQEIHAGLITL